MSTVVAQPPAQIKTDEVLAVFREAVSASPWSERPVTGGPVVAGFVWPTGHPPVRVYLSGGEDGVFEVWAEQTVERVFVEPSEDGWRLVAPAGRGGSPVEVPLSAAAVRNLLEFHRTHAEAEEIDQDVLCDALRKAAA